jgi:hypothetical protein
MQNNSGPYFEVALILNSALSTVEMYKALDSDPETRKFLNEIIRTYWESGSYTAAYDKLKEPVEEPDTPSTPSLAEALRNDEQKISFNQINPKNNGTKSRARYEAYKSAASIGAAKQLGATKNDLNHDFRKEFMTIHPNVLPCAEPPPLPDDSGGVTHSIPNGQIQEGCCFLRMATLHFVRTKGSFVYWM